MYNQLRYYTAIVAIACLVIAIMAITFHYYVVAMLFAIITIVMTSAVVYLRNN